MSYLMDEREIFAREAIREQANRPHVFVRKLMRRYGTNDAKPTLDAADIGIDTFASVHSAAEFALWAKLPLDISVTLDWDRLGIDSGREAQKATTAFIKRFTEWARQYGINTAWMYGIEAARTQNGLGFHSHVVLHVPGIPQRYEGELPPLNYRARFKKWAKGYTLRTFGTHIPRAVQLNIRIRESTFRHWMAVTYLLKGYARSALVQTGRATIDARPTYLGDLIPWPYCNPGPVDVSNRIRVCHGLGPKYRTIGAPEGMEHLLPTLPNWQGFKVEGPGLSSASETSRISPTVPKSIPFIASWEDAIRDVRRLYSHDFYRYVTRQEPYELAPPLTRPDDEPICHRISMAETLWWSTYKTL